MKKKTPYSALSLYMPILLGLIACFLPDTKYMLKGAGFTTKISNDYSGWIIIFLLLLFAAYSFIRQRKQSHIPIIANLIMGIYLLGFALFRAYQALTLYSGDVEGSLAGAMDTSAKIREGLLLLALTGIWFITRGITRKPA